MTVMLLSHVGPGKAVKNQSMSSKAHHIRVFFFFSFKAEISCKLRIFRKPRNIKFLLRNITCERKEGKHMEHVPEHIF